MLGDNIGELRGQNISTRVLPDEGQGPRMEVTERSLGTLCGVHVDATVTYVGSLRPNATIAGSGTGVVMTEDGEAAAFRSTGVGRMIKPGVTSWRGAAFYETQAQK